MSGILYGVGVGPGDPKLLTLKAVQTIKDSDIIAIPVSDSTLTEAVYEEAGQRGKWSHLLQKCVAYQIALPEIPQIENKGKLYLPMPMVKEKERLKQVHDDCAQKTARYLEEGKQIAFLTLGDPTIYSTYLYVHKRIQKKGYPVCIIPGIPSFCAAAAAMGIGLVENKEELHVIPASYGIEGGLTLPGTKVLMKAGKKMPCVKETVKKQGLQMQMVENCTMETENIYRCGEDIPDEAGYYSLIIIKEEH